MSYPHCWKVSPFMGHELSDLFPQEPRKLRQDEPGPEFVERYSEIRRQYLRAREYCGFSLDQLINSRSAQRYLSEIWLLGCMVRKPWKANVLPPGNPFRTQRLQTEHAHKQRRNCSGV
jgi:hypothetical protein